MRDRRGGGKGFLPPPPGGPARRDDRRYGGRDAGPRRRRSPSPGFHRGGSPPPFKRGRYGGRDDDMYGPRGGGYDGYHGRPSPPRERHGPRSYKDFCRTLPDDVTPEEAQKEYQQYLSEYWGSEVKADFESKKNEEWMRRRFDPRGMRKAMEDRNDEAKQSAESFLQDVKNGTINPTSEDFNQGAVKSLTKVEEDAAGGSDKEDEAMEEGDEKSKKKGSKQDAENCAHEVCWLPGRLATDLQLSHQLILQLDQEKGITNNTLVSPSTEDTAAKNKSSEANAQDKPPAASETPAGASPVKPPESETPNGIPSGTDGTDPAPQPAAGSANGEATPLSTPPQTGEAELKDTDMDAGVSGKDTAEIKQDAEMSDVQAQSEQPNAAKEPLDVEETIRKLDLQLIYLWKIHSLDFYAGKENADPMFYALRTTTDRRIRGPRPEEGEQGADQQAEKKALKQVEKHIDQVWKKRLVSGDPFAALLQEEKAGRLLEEWVNDQVKKIDDKKWGCKLSQKLFVGRDYVLKHIRVKHQEKVEEQKSKILDEIFWENYKKFREEEKKLMQAELEKMQQAIQLQKGGLPMPWDPKSASPMAGTMGSAGMAGMAAPGFPGGMGMGAMMGGGMMPQPGQVLVLAPGAGPMGPFISVPIAEAARPGRGPFPRGPPPRGPMGGRGGGRGFGLPPAMGMMPPMGGRGGGRGYFDLDNPTNNRAVLDYGDL